MIQSLMVDDVVLLIYDGSEEMAVGPKCGRAASMYGCILWTFGILCYFSDDVLSI